MKSDHPDANLLTAFGEGKLLRRERDEVLAHIAECPDCRETLAMASATAQQPASVRSAPAMWRWAAAATAVVLIAGAGWGLRLAIRSPERATVTPMPTPSKTEIAASAPAALPERAAESKKAVRERPSMVASKPFIAPAHTAGVPRAQAAGSVRQAPLAVIAPGVQAPAMADEVSKSIALPAAPAPAELTQREGSLKRPSESSGQFMARSWKASAGLAAQTGTPKHGVVWRIASSSIERSPDGGKTWETVAISEDVGFRAVAADGPDIWAGGSLGALFHSSDGGSNWVRVNVAEKTGRLTGSIIAIRLPQPSEIVLETDSAEQWISRDGGIEWQRL